MNEKKNFEIEDEYQARIFNNNRIQRESQQSTFRTKSSSKGGESG